MINVNNVNKLSSLFSSIFSYGFRNGYTANNIEEKLIRSFFVNELENRANDSFFYNYTDKELLEKTFHRKIDDGELLHNNPLFVWLGDIYSHLFFKFNKSLSYLFLYIPIQYLIELFEIYHEMDISMIDDLFLNKTKESSLLKNLIVLRHLSIGRLSALTLIKENTIKSYIKNDKTLYNAKFEYIKRLSFALDVDINIFRERIDNHLTSDMYLFDKENIKYRHYLGFIISSYFNKEIRNGNYIFSNNELIGPQSRIKVIWTSTNEIDFLKRTIDDLLNNADNANNYLIIFNYSTSSDIRQYSSYLSRLQYKSVMVIDNNYYYEINKDKIAKRKLTNQLCETSIQLAKRMYGEEFSI